MFDLTGKVAIVTGGNGGIGLGIARGLARAGATLLLVGRDAAKTGRAVAEIEALGGQASRRRRRCDGGGGLPGLRRGRRCNATAGSTSWSTMPAPTGARRRRPIRWRSGGP